MKTFETIKSIIARNRCVRVLAGSIGFGGELSSFKSAARGQKSRRDNAAETRDRSALRRLVNPRGVAHFCTNPLLNFVGLITSASDTSRGFFASKFFRFPAAGQNAASKFRTVFIEVKCVCHNFILVPQPGSSVLLGTLKHNSGSVYTQI
jgi:hypothetical protein